MAEVVRAVAWGCMLVCVALIGVGVFVYYLVRELFRGRGKDDG